MPSANILIITELGYEDKVVKKLRETEHVKEAYMVSGVYDICTLVDVPDMAGLETAKNRIKGIEGVRTSLALVHV